MNTTTEIRPLNDREFDLLQQLIYREAGIFLTDAKKALVSGRLTRRLRELGFADFSSYYQHVESNQQERTVMLDCISTNETRFFREPKQFEFLDEVILPQWRALGASGAIPKRIRAWSAACSTGEEPYSLAMTLASHFPASEGWNVEILASDLSTRVLAIAREGVWPLERANEVPDEFKKAYMLKGIRSEEGRVRIDPKLKALIDFRRINLNNNNYGVDGVFDLIFCRNVLIYFNKDSKARVIRSLQQHLSPLGLLFLGHAESLMGASHGMESAGPTVYRKVSNRDVA